MSKKLWWGILGGSLLALCGVTIWAVTTYIQLSQSRTDLSSARDENQGLTVQLQNTSAELTKTKTELGATSDQLQKSQAELGDTQTKLANADQKLSAAEADLTTSKTDLENTRTELNTANQKLEATSNDLTTLRTDLDTAKATIRQQQIEVNTAKSILGDKGIYMFSSDFCFDVELEDNPASTCPTLQQLIDFLEKDKTESHEYLLNVYDCSQFSRDIHNHAEAAGIQTAEIQIEFKGEDYGHAINAFLTSDYGLVFIDCTGGEDTIARVEVGKEYRSLPVDEVPRDKMNDDTWWDKLHSYYSVKGTKYISTVTHIAIYW